MFAFDLHENEKFVSMRRKTEISLIKPALITMVCVYFPLWFALKYELLSQLMWYLIVWIVIVALFAIRSYFFWLINVYLITTKRVVAVRYLSLLDKETEEIFVNDISGIKQKSGGIVRSLLDFGTLELQGGSHSGLQILEINHPLVLKDLILNLKEKAAFRPAQNKEFKASEPKPQK